MEVIQGTRLDSNGELHFLFMPRRAIMLNFNSVIVIVIVVFYLAHCEITFFILLHDKFLQFDWLRTVVFQLNLKYLHVKITSFLREVV